MSWGIVSTVKADLHVIAGFAAHHINLGCSSLDIFLDADVKGISALQHPTLRFHQGTKQPEALHRRQMINANTAYAQAEVDWLAHIDSDEFLLPETSLEQQLSSLGPETHWAKVLPAEALAKPAGTGPTHFKLQPNVAHQPRSVLEDLYPDYGLHLRSGFLSHSEGKPIARTGLKAASLGIHKLLGVIDMHPQTLDNTKLLHFHAPSYDQFQKALSRRLADTSYVSSRNETLSIAELLHEIDDEAGEEGVKAFYNTLHSSSPAHLNALRRKRMLLSHDLKLDRKIRRVFGDIGAQYP